VVEPPPVLIGKLTVANSLSQHYEWPVSSLQSAAGEKGKRQRLFGSKCSSHAVLLPPPIGWPGWNGHTFYRLGGQRDQPMDATQGHPSSCWLVLSKVKRDFAALCSLILGSLRNILPALYFQRSMRSTAWVRMQTSRAQIGSVRDSEDVQGFTSLLRFREDRCIYKPKITAAAVVAFHIEILVPGLYGNNGKPTTRHGQTMCL
jgi:hypothetical protein